MKILILFAHPALQKSRINRQLINGLDKIENLTFHDLYEMYPHFDIDIKYEQKMLSEHDCIIFHYPVYWFSAPSILKEWTDLVLQHGWAYGSQGHALDNKLFFNTMTLGAKKEAYRTDGNHGHALEEYLLPIRRTAKFCRMVYLPPFAVFGTYQLESNAIEQHRQQYHKILQTITEDKFDKTRAMTLSCLNDYHKI